mgnify:CR=1 FL=1
MKIIRITTDLEMTVHDFPEGTRSTKPRAEGADRE